MNRKWIDYIAGVSAVIALLLYVLAVALQLTGLLEKRTLCSNLIVGYPVGFFGAWFLQRFCDLLKAPRSVFSWAWNSFGTDRDGRIIASLLVPPIAVVGLLLILAPVLGSADRSTLVAVLVGATLYSEFTAPSFRLHQTEVGAT